MSFSQRLMQMGPRNRAGIRIVLRFGLIALFAMAIGASYGIFGLTRTFADAAPSVQKYLGYWSYDPFGREPLRSTVTNRPTPSSTLVR